MCKLFALMLACACFQALPQEVRSNAAPKVKVYVYRYKQYVGKGIRPSVVCDEREIARLQSGRMVVLALKPGTYAFRSNDKQSQIDLHAKPGQDYYIRVEIATGFMKGHGRLVLVQPDQGAAEVRQMKPADQGMIKDSDLLAPDFAPAK